MNIMEKFSLTRKVAIVTGASKGLGRSMAIGLAQAGASVAVVSRTKNLIEDTAAEIIRNGGDAIAIPTDVTSEEDIERMTAIVFEKFGKIDILVNNAGMGGSKISVNLTTDEWDLMMNTNTKSIFLASRAVGKIMIRQRSGKLINISSILGDRPLPTSLHYGASKAAVINMTKALALEWARFRINVNGIAPGYFVTEMTKEQQEGENQKYLLTKIPFGRFGSSDEIAGLAVFLASPAADYMTGQTVFIDGGYSV